MIFVKESTKLLINSFENDYMSWSFGEHTAENNGVSIWIANTIFDCDYYPQKGLNIIESVLVRKAIDKAIGMQALEKINSSKT